MQASRLLSSLSAPVLCRLPDVGWTSFSLCFSLCWEQLPGWICRGSFHYHRDPSSSQSPLRGLSYPLPISPCVCPRGPKSSRQAVLALATSASLPELGVPQAAFSTSVSLPRKRPEPWVVQKTSHCLNKWMGFLFPKSVRLRVSGTYRLRADTFLGDFFFSLGRDWSCSNPSLSKSCLMAMLASCTINLKVSLMLRNTEKKCSLDRVLTLITSGRNSVARFSSWVMSTHRITSLAEHREQGSGQLPAPQNPSEILRPHTPTPRCPEFLCLCVSTSIIVWFVSYERQMQTT